MKKRVFKKNLSDFFRISITPILFTLAVITTVIFGLRRAESSSRAEGLRLLEEGLLRAAVKCYAIEGSYPDSLSYLEARYGVYIDRTKYAVHYEMFASNLLPGITVIELGE